MIVKANEVNANILFRDLMPLVREKLHDVDLDIMEAATGINAQTLRSFRRGSIPTPRIDTLIKLVEYLLPEARVYWDDAHVRPLSHLSAKKRKMEQELDEINSTVRALGGSVAGKVTPPVVLKPRA